MIKSFKSIEELIEDKDNFIKSIPNFLGINLVSVKGIEYLRQEDGQLVEMKIIFIPAEMIIRSTNVVLAYNEKVLLSVWDLLHSSPLNYKS